MTREFNKQRRDDSRPSFRNQSSSRSGDERSARPARPRLSRETVDRAWESGAQQQHADYRPRSGNGQAPRTNWRSEHSSSQNGSSGNRPYGNRSDNYRETPQRFERSFNHNQGSRSNDPGRRNFDDQRSGERPHSTQKPDSTGQDFRDKVRPQNGETQFPNRNSGYQQRGFSRGERPSGGFNRNERPVGGFNRGERPSGGFNRGERPSGGFNRSERPSGGFNRGERSFGGFNRGERPSRDFGPRSRTFRDRDEQPQRGPDTQNPRWQSRSWTRPHPTIDEQQELPAQFEGDYERFDNHDVPTQPIRPARSTDKPPHENHNNRNERGRRHGSENRPFKEASPHNDEAHVTRLPDGRVLKGSRPQQRKNAQFWTNVAENAEELVDLVHIPKEIEETSDRVHISTKEEDTEHVAESQEKLEANPIQGEEATLPKSSKRVAGVATRTRKTVTSKAISKPKPRSIGPRPSQRGYQWPTP